MGRVLTNAIGLNYSIEKTGSIGEAADSPVWRQLQPNSIGTLGASITTVARDPISQLRQRQRGTITDLDSAVDFEHDLTLSAFRDFAEGFVFAKSSFDGYTEINPSATTTSAITVPTLSAALVNGELVYMSGFANSGNNGVMVTSGTQSTTSIGVASLTAETSAPAAARVSVCGVQLTSATWAYTAGTKQATITKTGAFAAAAAGRRIQVGQMVHIGSPSSTGLKNGLTKSAGNKFGYGRVIAKADNVITLDKLSTALQDNTGITMPTADILYGDFIRNVGTTHTSYLERTYRFEAVYPGLGTANATEYQYSVGNFSNTLGINLPLTEKATMALAFIGTDVNDITATREASSATRMNPLRTGAFNTTADIARLRVTELDEDGLSTDFKSLTITLNNNVSPEKVVGKLGARFMNAGNFEVNLEAQMLFTSKGVVDAVRDNTAVSMDFIVQNPDGLISIDIPSMTLGGADREYPTNESVLVNLTGAAYQDETLNTSIGISMIPVPGLSES